MNQPFPKNNQISLTFEAVPKYQNCFVFDIMFAHPSFRSQSHLIFSAPPTSHDLLKTVIEIEFFKKDYTFNLSQFIFSPPKSEDHTYTDDYWAWFQNSKHIQCPYIKSYAVDYYDPTGLQFHVNFKLSPEITSGIDSIVAHYFDHCTGDAGEAANLREQCVAFI